MIFPPKYNRAAKRKRGEPISVPMRLMRFQGDMLKTLSSILMSSVTGHKAPQNSIDEIHDVTVQLPAPDAELLLHYRKWVSHSVQTENGQQFQTDRQYLPSHLFSQFALSVCAEQLKLLPFQLSKVINQGVGMTVLHPIPTQQDLTVTCKLVDVKETDGKARVHQELIIGTQQQPRCCIVDFHTVFIQGKPSLKVVSEKPATPEVAPIGQWQVATNDGWNFALLTGDFNPIHWFGFIAKFSPFKQKVLHGFGMFTRSVTTLEHYFASSVNNINVRFVKPAALNNQHVTVCASDVSEEGKRYFELRDEANNVLMVGDFSIAS